MLTDARPHDGTTVRAFDLTREPWLPVQLRDGSSAQLSLVEVFERAAEIRRLVGDLPTQDFALLRLLLAICHDALDGPADDDAWAELWESPNPFAPIPAYLARHADRFDLLSPTAPFYQTPGLRTAKGEVSSLNRIVADVPNGNPFFTTRFPGVETITLAEAARWTVHVHAYDTSGIKSGVVGDERVKGGKAYPLGVAWPGCIGGVAIEGDSLRETLVLNLIAEDFHALQQGDGDKPSWRRAVPAPGPQLTRADDPKPRGLRDLYTWQSRRLLLDTDGESVRGVVLTYGDPLAPQNMQTLEPMTGWRRSTAQEKKLGLSLVYMSQEHEPSRSAWRGLASLITPHADERARSGDAAAKLCPRIVSWVAHLCTHGALPRKMLIRAHTYGMVYGTQQSIVEEVVEDELSMPVVLLNEANRELGATAIQAVEIAEKAVDALGWLAADLAKASLYNDKRRVQGDDKELADIARDTARDRAYAVLDQDFRHWLRNIGDDDDPERIATTWQEIARQRIWRLSRELLDGAGDAAWSGRIVKNSKGEEIWLNAAVADRKFSFQLRRVLPRAFPEAAGQSDAEAGDAPEPEDQDSQEAHNA